MAPEERAADRSTLYRFKLDCMCGRGGTGTVYRAIDTEDGSVKAIKLFHANFFRNRLHIRDLAKSVARFKKLSHNNVTQIYEFIDGKEGQCLVLEYVDGPDLKWYIANRPWNLHERLVIVAQVCNGLQYLHDQDLTHHDLKPANVLFTRKGVAKLVDFSLCGTSHLLALIDRSVHEQVTPLYIAPELIRREKATPKSDMYSLGIILYLLFTETVPFETDNLTKLYQCHLTVTPDHPTERNKRCPRPLGDLIMRMLDKQPENRFETCDQIRIMLASIGRSRI